MKYLKRYNDLDESIRDKMTGISEEDALEKSKKFDPFNRMLRGITLHMVDMVKDGIRDNVNLKGDIEYDSQYLFRMAIWKGRYEIVELLLKHGADPHILNGFPIRYAAANKDEELVRILLKYGVDIEDSIKKIIRTKQDQGLKKEDFESIDFLRQYGEKHGVNEGLRDKMVGKSEEDIIKSVKKTLGIDSDYIQVKLPEPKEPKKIKTLIELSDEHDVEIEDYKDNNILICGELYSVYNFMKIYLNYAQLNVRNTRRFHIDYIKDNIVTDNLNEGLLDKMTAKSDKDIIFKLLSENDKYEALIKAFKKQYMPLIKYILERDYIADDSKYGEIFVNNITKLEEPQDIKFLLDNRNVRDFFNKSQLHILEKFYFGMHSDKTIIYEELVDEFMERVEREESEDVDKWIDYKVGDERVMSYVFRDNVLVYKKGNIERHFSKWYKLDDLGKGYNELLLGISFSKLFNKDVKYVLNIVY